MTELYINNQLAELPTDFNITLVTENLYFSKASTFSYEVKLPMSADCQNAKIFGFLHRNDKHITTRQYPAQLIVNNRVVLRGTAVIVNVTDNSVSVQLLQGNSEFSWKQRYEKTYINEMDLGTVAEWGLARMTESQVEELHIVPQDQYATQLDCGYKVFVQETVNDIMDGNVVYTPIRNEETGLKMNHLRTLEGCVFLSAATSIEEQAPTYGQIIYPRRLAPQPKLLLIINKVLQALGYTIVRNELSNNTLVRNIFIANSTIVWKIADMLPHLTVVEFIEQIQVLCNCVIVLKDDMTAYIITRAQYYDALISPSDGVQNLNEVIDEYQVDVDTETQVSDSDKARIYDISYDDFGKLFLGHEFDNVKIAEGTDIPEYPEVNPNIFAIDYRGHKVSSPYRTNGDVTGQEIDHFCASPSEGEEEYTLKFVPIYPIEISRSEMWITYSSSRERIDMYYIVPPAIGKVIEPDEDYSIQQILDDGGVPEEPEQMEKICIGFKGKASMQYPSGNLDFYYLTALYGTGETIPADDWSGDQTGIAINAQQFDLSMFPWLDLPGETPIKNLYEKCYKNTNAINTSIVYNIRFVTNKVIDALLPVNIKNQRYAIKQIKYTINAKGFLPIAEGEFYKL